MNNDLQKLWNTVKQLDQEKKWDELIPVLTEIIRVETDPNKKLMAYSIRGDAYFNKHEHDLAIDDFNKAIKLNPDVAEFYYNRGNVYDDKNEYDRAIADFNKAIKLKPDYAEAYYNRGIAYDNKNEAVRAIADFDKAIELKPDLAYGRKGEHDRAITDFNQAIDLKLDYAEAYNDRGNAYFRKREYDLAIADYDKAIELKPDYADAYSNRGLAYIHKDEDDRAITDFDKAIELNPEHVAAYLNRGLVYAYKGKDARAIDDLGEVIKRKPDEALAYIGCGLVYLAKEDYEKAAENFWDTGRYNPALKYSNLHVYIACKIFSARTSGRKGDAKAFKPFLMLARKIAFIQKELFYQPQKTGVAHYTSLFALKNIIEKKHFHLYNAAYMNDPEEGRVFFEIMKNHGGLEEIENLFYGKSEDHPYRSPAYIGSFIKIDEDAQEYKDSLPLWRTYGKQDGKEAAGSCLVFKPERFADSHSPKIGAMEQLRLAVLQSAQRGSEGENYVEQKNVKPTLYRIIYKNMTNRPSEENDSKLSTLLDELAESLNKVIEHINKCDEQQDNLKELTRELLDSIRFLFKSDHYKEEREVRIIDIHYYQENTGQGSDRNQDMIKVDAEQIPPRFYLETQKDFSCSEVILGPRARRIEEWKRWIKDQNSGIRVQKSKIKYGNRD